MIPDDDTVSLLDSWARGPLMAATIPDTGTIHQTLLLTTPTGAYALRTYCYADRSRVEYEHALIAHACAHGLPAVAPLPLPNGATILESDGWLHALFLRAAGQQVHRDALGIGQATAMGSFLADVHRVMHSFPVERARRRSVSIDREATLAGIRQLDETIRSRPSMDEVDEIALAQLAVRRDWLERAAVADLPDLSMLSHQVIHGDYQESNLFFQKGRVSAIIDWDQAYVAPRTYEVVRTLDLVFKLDGPLSRAFLAAYRRQLPLTSADLDLTARWYGLMRAHDLWHYHAAYLDGNERVRAFIRRGSFVPFTERWAELRTALW